jgi:hypothetical protein
MDFKEDAEIAELVRLVETCEINPAEFKHYQHMAVALWYIAHFPYDEACRRMREGIQRLATAYGKMGYHETITLFWLEVVCRFFAESPKDEALANTANRLSLTMTKNLIFDYYSEELVTSAQAKASWVEPDLKPLQRMAVTV